MLTYLGISFCLLLMGIGYYFVVYKNKFEDVGFKDRKELSGVKE